MKLLVGYDGSNSAKDAVQLAKSHAKCFGAKVYAITCVTQTQEVSKDDMDNMELADQELNQLKEAFETDGIVCEARLVVGDLPAGEALVKFAKENDIDEIFIGIRRRSKVGKLLFGSAAQYIILESPCPVVTVK
jgi:nucleotide-binding universal stress UspA family protein